MTGRARRDRKQAAATAVEALAAGAPVVVEGPAGRQLGYHGRESLWMSSIARSWSIDPFESIESIRSVESICELVEVASVHA